MVFIIRSTEPGRPTTSETTSCGEPEHPEVLRSTHGIGCSALRHRRLLQHYAFVSLCLLGRSSLPPRCTEAIAAGESISGAHSARLLSP